MRWKRHNAKKQKTKRKRQQFPRLTSIQQYPFDSSKQQIVKWTRIPLPLPEKHHNMGFYQLWMSILILLVLLFHKVFLSTYLENVLNCFKNNLLWGIEFQTKAFVTDLNYFFSIRKLYFVKIGPNFVAFGSNQEEWLSKN